MKYVEPILYARAISVRLPHFLVLMQLLSVQVAHKSSLTPSSRYQITAVHHQCTKSGIPLILNQRIPITMAHLTLLKLLSEDCLEYSVQFLVGGKRTTPALLFEEKEIIIIKPIKRRFGWFILHTSFFQALVGEKWEATADKMVTTIS